MIITTGWSKSYETKTQVNMHEFFKERYTHWDEIKEKTTCVYNIDYIKTVLNLFEKLSNKSLITETFTMSGVKGKEINVVLKNNTIYLRLYDYSVAGSYMTFERSYEANENTNAEELETHLMSYVETCFHIAEKTIFSDTYLQNNKTIV